jgi:hypothetical protein
MRPSPAAALACYQWQLPGWGWPTTNGTPVGLICIAMNTAGFPCDAFVAL